MKKLLFSLVACIALSFAANAQLGVRAGLNIANQSISVGGADVSFDSRIGAQLGLVYETMINENVSFRPGIMYSMKGFKITDGTTEQTSKVDYLDIPLDFTYKLAAGSNKISLHAGPYVGVLLSAKVGDEDNKESYNSVDFGANLGLAYELPSFTIGFNYGLGLANIANVEDGDDSSAKNTNLSFFGIYKF